MHSDYCNVMKDDKYDNFIIQLKQYLIENIPPDDRAICKRVTQHASNFMMNQDQSLHRKLKDRRIAPYVEPLFQGDFMEQMHLQFEHLSYTVYWHGNSRLVANNRGRYKTVHCSLLKLPNCTAVTSPPRERVQPVGFRSFYSTLPALRN